MIGGLVMSTFATLLVLPSIFAVVIGGRSILRRRFIRMIATASSMTRTSTRKSKIRRTQPCLNPKTTIIMGISKVRRLSAIQAGLSLLHPRTKFLPRTFPEIGRSVLGNLLMHPFNVRFIMNRFSWPNGWSRCGGYRWLVLGALAFLASGGCEKNAKNIAPSVAEPPIMRVSSRNTGKLSALLASRALSKAMPTSIYPKVTGYIEKWNVDIGDKVKKGDVVSAPSLCRNWSKTARRSGVQLSSIRDECPLPMRSWR